MIKTIIGKYFLNFTFLIYEESALPDWKEKINSLALPGFYIYHNKDINEVYAPVINNYIEQGYMTEDNDRIMLTDAGIDVSNYILSDFILDDRR